MPPKGCPGNRCRPPRRSERCLWALALLASNVFADVDISEYQTRQSVRDPAQARALQQQFAQERQREAERLRAEQAALARQSQAAAAREAALPFPERLTRDRCTKCHPADRFAGKRHSRLFWYLTVQRMVLLNDAELAPDESPVITAYLSETYAADGVRATLETASPIALAAVIWGLLRAVRRARRATAGRHKEKRNTPPFGRVGGQ